LYYLLPIDPREAVMHTDEYEIALSKELAVCKSAIKKIREFFAIMERKHNKTTAQFVEEYDSGKLTDNRGDYVPWRNNYESLKRWEELQRQYEEAFRMMKI
jgi:hypothetical protein